MISMLHFTQRNVRVTQFVAILTLFFNRGESGKCPNCKNCTEYDGKPWCVACAKGFFWAGRGQCYECDKNCNNCTSSNCAQLCKKVRGECVSGCKTGYYRYHDVALDAYSCKDDGHWSEWSGYSECSTTCGYGTRYRHRTCDNPKPSDGGMSCRGNDSQSKPCLEKICAVDGQWSDWQDWSECSVTCERGSQTRVRTCDNPAPQNKGLFCFGKHSEVKACEQTVCPAVDGIWAQWSEYSECSTSCGAGTRFRYRSCDIQDPPNVGKSCEGNSWQAHDCFESVCAGNSENISGGLVAGAVTGAVLITAVVVIVVAITLKRRRQRQNIQDPSANQTPETQGMETGPLQYEALTERPQQNITYMELDTREYESVDEHLGSHMKVQRTEYENV